jgi:prepilin-type N-terminal cleavage/methylation domain-containing protein
MPSSPKNRSTGFTLVELLVVIAIIGVLVALLLPAVQAAREAARRSSCSNKLRQLAIGLHNHHDTHNKLPPGAQGVVYPQPNPPGNTTTGITGTSWIVFTLPFFEQQPLYDKYRFDLSHFTTENGGTVGSVVVPTLYCPSGPDPKKYVDPNAGVAGNPSTHYYGVMGPGGATDNFQLLIGGTTYQYRYGSSGANGAWSYHGMLSHYQDIGSSISQFRVVRFSDVTDGTTNTLMLGEISLTLPVNMPGTTTAQPNQYRSWIRGNTTSTGANGSGTTKNVRYPINSTFYNGSNNFNEISFGSHHPGGAQFALGDASVRFISQTIDLLIYQASASMNQKENATLP